MFLIVFISSYLLSSTVFATINTEALRDYSITPGLHSSISQGMKIEMGNNDEWEVNLGINLRFLDKSLENSLLPRQSIVFTSDYNLGELDTKKDSSSGFGHLRWTKYLNTNIAFELFSQYEFDEFNQLEKRILLGTGVRLPFIYSEVESFFVGASFMLEQEKIQSQVNDDNNNRLSIYISYLKQLHSKAFFNTTTYFQPNIDRLSDYRISIQNSISFPLNQSLDLSVSNSIKYDHQPLPGVESFDLTLSNQLRFNF